MDKSSYGTMRISSGQNAEIPSLPSPTTRNTPTSDNTLPICQSTLRPTPRSNLMLICRTLAQIKTLDCGSLRQDDFPLQGVSTPPLLVEEDCTNDQRSTPERRSPLYRKCLTSSIAQRTNRSCSTLSPRLMEISTISLERLKTL